MNWNLQSKIEKILDTNIKEIPYEGKDVNKRAIMDSVCELTENLSIGFITWCFTNKVTRDTNGYLFEDKYWARRDLFNEFINRQLN